MSIQTEKFLTKIKSDRDVIFNKMVEDYETTHKDSNYFNGPNLKIEPLSDYFLYLSEDKRQIDLSKKFEIDKSFSFLIYFSKYDHVANYTNGGIQLIGFYNDKLAKVNEIPINEFKIKSCPAFCNFKARSLPSFFFQIEHSGGNKHRTTIALPYSTTSCQEALDCIWQLEKFYLELRTKIQKANDGIL